MSTWIVLMKACKLAQGESQIDLMQRCSVGYSIRGIMIHAAAWKLKIDPLLQKLVIISGSATREIHIQEVVPFLHVTSRFMQYLSFCDLHTSFSIMSWRFIHVAGFPSFFKAGEYSSVYARVCVCVCVYPFVCWIYKCSTYLWIVLKWTRKCQYLFQDSDFSSFW